MRRLLAVAALAALAALAGCAGCAGCALTPPRRPIFTLPDAPAVADSASVSMTLPTCSAELDSLGNMTCAPSTTQMHDLERLELWGARRYGTGMGLVAEYDVRGMEGLPFVCRFATQGEPVWTVKVRTWRTGSPDPSNWSNLIGTNLAPGIPDPSRDACP